LVRAPLGSRELVGVVWVKAEGSVAADKLRTAQAVDRRLPETLCSFIYWVARYTRSPPGAVLAQCFRVPGAFDAEVHRRALILGNAAACPRATKARERVLKLMADGVARGPAEIAELAGTAASVARGLADTG